ncbi:MAG TPA: hypothetical protein VF516_00260 [Kofleriaceae bacterium]
MITMDWERVESKGALVYWRRRLIDRSYLAVVKQTTGEHAGRWRWQHRGPEIARGTGTVVHAEGFRARAETAQRAADQHVNYRYGIDDTCGTCGVLARECGHRFPETSQEK